MGVHDMWWLALAWADPGAIEPVRHEISGCAASVDDLPDSPLFRADDPRWKRDGILVVLKDKRRTMVFDGGELATLDDGTPACWAIGLGAGYPAGHKQRLGDMKTPEGWYRTSDRPWSVFYSAISIHYPEVADARRGVRTGLITAEQGDAIVAQQRAARIPDMDTRLGGKILFHGGGSSSDWTLGCIALEDDDIDAMRERIPRSKKTWTLILP